METLVVGNEPIEAPIADTNIVDTGASSVGGATEITSASDGNTALAAENATEVAKTEEVKVAETAPATETKSEESEFQPLTQEAWDWYQNNQSLGSGIRPSNYFTGRNCQLVSNVLDRSITLDEIKSMIVPDGEPTECAICHKQFQPVRYLVVTEQLLEGLKTLPFDEAVAGFGMWRGSFFWPPEHDMFAVCGSPFKFNPKTRQSFHPADSHLVVAFNQNVFADHKGGKEFPHWGLARERAEEIGQRREERSQAFQAVNQTASALFARKGRNGGSLNGGSDWVPGQNGGNGNGNGRHGYRGQHGKTARREEKRFNEMRKG